MEFGCRDAGIEQRVKEGGWRHPSENRAPMARFSQTNGGVWCQRVGGDVFGWGNVEFGCGNTGIERRAKKGG